MVDLLDIVEELESWEAGVGLILRGASNKSNIFCSGGDLKTVHEISGEKHRDWPQARNETNIQVVTTASGCQFL